MRVLPLEPFGGDDPWRDGDAVTWDDATATSVREAAVGLLPFALEDVAWREDPELGPVAVGRTRRGELRLVAAVEVLDATRFVVGLERVARALQDEHVDRAGLVVLTTRVMPDVRGAVALVGPGIARVFLVELDEAAPRTPALASVASFADVAGVAGEPAGDGRSAASRGATGPAGSAGSTGSGDPDDAREPEDLADPVETPAGGSHLTSARGRRRGRPAVPALDPREQLGVVAALVGETELSLDGTDGRIRGVLSPEGLIVVAGETFDDPLEAAVAQGREVSDGWAAWRFGIEGPYLGEALEEALNPQSRTKRPQRRRAVRR
ncbi:hypothetical protein EDD28_0752 [Salana multivorans]|uniref:RAMA domain-containing protein n=1 Tax=Salana multivorans TaxID=120377 RepID=A0A3N2D8R2_9MICO|nr:hypothetical protein [Salana multivorans]ROR96176.1 hypothetical protein EDD28_0752 [Salana multivorans]